MQKNCSFLCFAFVSLSLLFLGTVAQAQDETDAQFKQSMLDEHNKWRKEYAATQQHSSAWRDLVWDEVLAQESKAHSTAMAKGEHAYGHNYADLQAKGGRSENIAMGLTAKNGTDAWYSEKADYDKYSGNCPDDVVCGHYASMIRGGQGKVGCGIDVKTEEKEVEGQEEKEIVKTGYITCRYTLTSPQWQGGAIVCAPKDDSFVRARVFSYGSAPDEHFYSYDVRFMRENESYVGSQHKQPESALQDQSACNWDTTVAQAVDIGQTPANIEVGKSYNFDDNGTLVCAEVTRVSGDKVDFKFVADGWETANTNANRVVLGAACS